MQIQFEQLLNLAEIQVLNVEISELTSQFGVAAACQDLAVPRSSFYRSRQVPSPKALGV